MCLLSKELSISSLIGRPGILSTPPVLLVVCGSPGLRDETPIFDAFPPPLSWSGGGDTDLCGQDALN